MLPVPPFPAALPPAHDSDAPRAPDSGAPSDLVTVRSLGGSTIHRTIRARIIGERHKNLPSDGWISHTGPRGFASCRFSRDPSFPFLCRPHILAPQIPGTRALGRLVCEG